MTVSRPHPATHIETMKRELERAEAYDHPMTATGSVGGNSGKPESREPGRTHADRLMEALERLYARCARDAKDLVDNAHIRERGSSSPVRIWGVLVGDLVDDEHLTDHRRKVRIEAVGESRVKRHLVAKYGEE